jgi:phosphoglycolate phosphatase-like HAD superfamily hydrolase
MLLLFDIDGTLLQNASREHARALRTALHEIYGLVDEEGAGEGGTHAGDGTPSGAPRPRPPTPRPRVQLAGRTDMEIAREIALRGGLAARTFDEGRADFERACVREYSRGVPPDLSERVVGGIPDLLGELHRDPGVRLSLVTGNLEGVARLKLAHAGLGGFFPPGQGGFGSDSEDRTDLPPIARARAGKPGEPYPRERTVVIGDTPRDIACAHSDGVRCIAVTTGPYEAEQLGQADAVAGSVAELRELLLAG